MHSRESLSKLDNPGIHRVSQYDLSKHREKIVQICRARIMNSLSRIATTRMLEDAAGNNGGKWRTREEKDWKTANGKPSQPREQFNEMHLQMRISRNRNSAKFADYFDRFAHDFSGRMLSRLSVFNQITHQTSINEDCANSCECRALSWQSSETFEL